MIINRIYETQKSYVAVACFLPGRAKDLSAPLYKQQHSNQPTVFNRSASWWIVIQFHRNTFQLCRTSRHEQMNMAEPEV